MWHVTLTVAGEAVDSADIKVALERLSQEHPFLLSGRFAQDRAEVRYWEEAVDVDCGRSTGRVLDFPPGAWWASKLSTKTPFTAEGDSPMTHPGS